MKRVVINFASGAWYPKGQVRLHRTLKENGYTGDFLGYQDPAKFGSPTHAEVPYAFKTYSFIDAVKRGYEQIIFADSSIFAVKSWDPVWDIISEQGYFFEEAGHWTGTWTKDSVLEKFEVTRDQAMKIPMLTAGFAGIDVTNPVGMDFLMEWHRFACDGDSFKGAWRNRNGEVSKDPRCEGHRHDMSVASLLAWKMGMKLGKGGTFLAYIGGPYMKPRDTVIAHLQPC